MIMEPAHKDAAHKDAARQKFDLTEGGILKKLLQIAVPIIGTQLITMAYNLTDLFWLGRVGSDAVASAGSAGMYLWLSFGFLLIGRMAAEIGVSQSFGKGDKKTAQAIAQNSMLIALVLGLIFGLTMVIFNRNLIGFFNFKESEVAARGAVYIRITGIPIPLVFMAAVVTGSFNASGNSRTPFIMNAIGLVINVILDPIFIFVLGMEVRGAAIATVIAQVISCGSLFMAFYVSMHRPFARFSFIFKPDIKIIARLLKWSVPIGLESILFCFLSMLCSRIEASFGADAIAAAKIGSQIESLSWLLGGGFSSALVAFIGQNHGAGKQDRIRKGTKIAAGIMAVWGSAIATAFLTLGPAIFFIFLPVQRLKPLGGNYLFIMAFCQLFMNLEGVGSGAFKGTGRTIPPSLASIIINSSRPILAFLLSRTSLGIYGVWISESFTAIVRGSWICIWYLLAERKKVKNYM